MALPTFPVSPLPADTRRMPTWASHDQYFDSGASQSDTAYVRPLYRYEIPWKNINEVKQNSLFNFIINEQKEGRDPFLMKDPYEYRVNSVLAVSINATQGSTKYLFDTNSFFIRADTTTIGSLTSNLSGYVTLGSEFDYDQDSGVLTINTIAATDFWTVSSAQYFRKVKMEGDYSEQAIIWNQFSVTLRFREVL